MIDLRIQAAEFDPGRQLARLGDLKKGAVAGFVGRIETDEEVAQILIDHHGPLARAELQRIAAEADSRWSLAGMVLIHRHGRLQPSDKILFAGVAARDIVESQQACAFLVEGMRTRLPFWRKDILADGSGRWR